MVDPHCPRCQNVKKYCLNHTMCVERLFTDFFLFTWTAARPSSMKWTAGELDTCGAIVMLGKMHEFYTTFMTIESKVDMDRTWWCLSRREERRGRPAPNILKESDRAELYFKISTYSWNRCGWSVYKKKWYISQSNHSVRGAVLEAWRA